MTNGYHWGLTPTGMKAHLFKRSLNEQALCGCHSPSGGWLLAEERNTVECCLRCLRLSQAETEIPPDAVENNVSVNFVQQVGEMTPVCNIAVPDVEAIIQLLKNLRPSESTNYLMQCYVDMVIGTLRKWIDESKERSSRATATTFTYHHPEK
jgi:hypothetical protein